MTPWRLLDDETARDGAWNMALDEALWLRAEEGRERRVSIRLFAWKPRCLSLGYHQVFRDACDAGFCQEAGIDVVRRPTGGKAVLHDDEVTYSVAAPFAAPAFEGLDLAGTYAVIARALASGLASLGLPVELHERGGGIAPTGSQPCFLVPSQQEILSGGRKVVGSAQRRGKSAFLQHGAVPLRIDYEELARASGRPAEDAALYRSSFTGIADLMPGVGPAHLRRALAAGFGEAFGTPPVRESPGSEEAALASRLKEERYANRAWAEEGRGRPEVPRAAMVG